MTTPKGFKEAYAQYIEGGWAALSCDPEYGGQGLPFVVNQCLYEMLKAPTRPGPCIRPLARRLRSAAGARHDEQKKTYLPKLVSGEWTGTMCLTEPHCGTDLGMLRTKAEPVAGAPEGTYKITGNKIFISAGEHDFTENIVHLVLARLPDAPKGSKGISLFVVPKYLVNADGSLGERNPIFCAGPGAQDGHPRQRHRADRHRRRHRHPGGGPAAQGPAGHVRDDERRPPGRGQPVAGPDRSGLPERAGLCQGPHPDAQPLGHQGQGQGRRPIIVHPDVRKMLLTAKAYAEGARALQIYCTLLLDKAHSHPDEKVRKDSDELVALLTPIVKAFITDNGHIATNHCMQVFGGHGFIKEWGMEQFVRDNRINMIYEGTNTIQSLDLLGRKVLGNNGATLKKLASWWPSWWRKRA